MLVGNAICKVHVEEPRDGVEEMLEVLPEGVKLVRELGLSIHDDYANGYRKLETASFVVPGKEDEVYLVLEEWSNVEYWPKLVTGPTGVKSILWSYGWGLPICEGGSATRREIKDRDEFMW